jgi:hypothetical protein
MSAAYGVNPALRWRVESDRILVARVPGGVVATIDYPAAAVWDFVVRGYDRARIARMMRHIAGFTDDQAALAFTSTVIDEWRLRELIVDEAG